MLRIQIKTNIAKDKAYSALLLSSTRICLTLDFLLKIVEDTNFYNFYNFQLLKYQSLGFPTLSNRNQHQTDSNSVLHLQILKNIILISSSSEKKSAATRCINHIIPVSIYLGVYSWSKLFTSPIFHYLNQRSLRLGLMLATIFLLNIMKNINKGR